MILRDLHNHTNFSDGKNSPEEMVLAAIEKGVETIGISDHSYTFFDESYCIKKSEIENYINTVNALKEKYWCDIEILLGVEQDFYSEEPTNRFDYVIGSVHYLKLGEEYVPVDESKEILLCAAEKYFNGDIYALVEEYYRTVGCVAEKTRADIVGHFDLITKFNGSGDLFDESHPRYVAAYRAAADRLLECGVPFEINTGAVSRGYKTSAYPSDEVTAYLKNQDAWFVTGSDSHTVENICYGFDTLVFSDFEFYSGFAVENQ